MSKRPRKPATILRELMACYRNYPATYALLRELSRAIATSGKAPGRP